MISTRRLHDDILILTSFIYRPFKYLSKAEIQQAPLVGFAMGIAGHVFLKRGDLQVLTLLSLLLFFKIFNFLQVSIYILIQQSTIEATDLTMKRLMDKNSMTLFAEGTRSEDGRLGPFKKGAFQMAKQAGVKIIPVSIGNLHRWMPKNALLPLAPIRDVYIKIHPAIETVDRPITKIRS